MKNVLLITSTIAPPPNAYLLKVTDPAERLSQYKAALGHYLRLVQLGDVDAIVYADNSGYPLDSLKALAKSLDLLGQVEFISFKSEAELDMPRFFLEMQLLEETLRRSDILGAGVDPVVWKVTGRYVVENAGRIIGSFPDKADLYINLRNHPRRTLDFYFFGFRLASYRQHVGKNLDAFRVRETGEDVLRRMIDEGVFVGASIAPRFRFTPRLKGVRGYDAGSYDGFSGTAKYLLRWTMNGILPKFWV